MVKVWCVENGEVNLKSELVHKSDVYDFSFSPDGKFLTVGEKNPIITLWDFKTKEKVKELQGTNYLSSDIANPHTVWFVDSKRFAIPNQKKCIIYDITGKLIIQFEIPNPICQIFFSPK